ncbi:MAG: DNA double-strand break repair nuclease NurA [Dehalococcoidia bacterium]
MSLNFGLVAGQLQDFSRRLTAEERQRQRRLERASQELKRSAAHPDDLSRRIDTARTRWLLARPMAEPPDGHYSEPQHPTSYVVLATDGSHIDVDRHIPVRCYLLNLGWACIGYGAYTHLTTLDSQPSLSFTDEELTFGDDRDISYEERVAGSILSALRSAREMELLASLIEGLPPDVPTLALLDGTLVLWGLSLGSVSSRARNRLLDEGVLAALERLRWLASQRPLVVASYISYPGSAEVTNALRLAVCPMGRQPCRDHGMVHPAVDCGHCPGNGHRPCDEVAGGTDRRLFQQLLDAGERSATFQRHPAGRESVYSLYCQQGHALAFFYLRMPEGVPDEVARVEMPIWNAQDSERVRLAHALLLDQCRRGLGYPVAIMEAHEQAVISGADREVFRQLLEDTLAQQHSDLATSAKSRSKRGRWL